ncbi:MAG: thiolase family protein [Frankia sp.]|nr:thiolase family protein [Frankia sp.]
MRLSTAPAASAALSREVAVAGIGESDYREDFDASRGRAPDRRPPTAAELMTVAFERALADAGLARDQVDGLVWCTDPQVTDAPALLGISPPYRAQGASILPLGMAAGRDVIPTAAGALAEGRCATLAVLYTTTPRTTRKQFGGVTYTGGGRNSYYYYHPWGWSSQAAHWALMFTYYAQLYGVTEADLGRVAVSLRAAATRNPRAIMRQPLTIEEYLDSPYVVRPLRRLDLCLPNDGAVCLILRRTQDARTGPRPPVLLAGWGDAEVSERKLHHLVKDQLATVMRAAGDAALAMAGLGLGDIGHFQGYDAATCHLVGQLEGYGFAKPGTGLREWAAGRFDLGGELPVNTSGGMLSEAYMHGWNFIVEAVRQLRGEAGARQVGGLAAAMMAITTTESAHPLILTRDGT